jgi:hypothetical protein
VKTRAEKDLNRLIRNLRAEKRNWDDEPQPAAQLYVVEIQRQIDELLTPRPEPPAPRQPLEQLTLF